MDKSLKIVRLTIWSIIAVVLTSVLIHGIRTGKNNGGFFMSFNLGGSAGKIQKEEEIELNNCNRIALDFSSEDIIISSTKDNKLKVVERSNGDLKENEKFTVSNRGEAIEIVKGDKKNFHIISFGNFNRKIELFIPESYNKNLEVICSSGNIKVENDLKLSNVNIVATSGNLKINGNLTANQVELKASSGNIKAQELLVKAYKIKASSGNIDIASIEGSGEVEARSGNVSIGYKDILDYSSVSANSGNVKIYVPKNLSFDFYGECSSGDIRSDFDINYKNKKGNEASLKVGSEPYKKIKAKTSSGNITINEK